MQNACIDYANYLTGIGEGFKAIFSFDFSNLGSAVAVGGEISKASTQIGWGRTFFFMTWPLDKIVDEIHRLQSASKIPGAIFKDRFGEERKYSDKDDEVLKTLIAAAEMVDRGYHIKNIDLMRSLGADWVVDKEDNAIIPPFSVISGLGAAAADTVVAARKDGPFISIEDLRDRTKLSQSDIETLRKLGVLDGMGETNQMTLF